MNLLLLACIAKAPVADDTGEAPPDDIADDDDHFYGDTGDTGSAGAAPVTYELEGTLYLVTYKDPDTLGADYAHDHVVRAVGWTGTATWDLDDPSACSASITVPVDDLAVDEDAMRDEAGLEGSLSDSDRAEVKDSMLAPEQLDGDAYSEIGFELTGCSSATGPVTLDGELRLHGQARTVAVEATVSASATEFLATGELDFLVSDYGIEPYSAYFGAVALLD
ncbi:MAG: YceI family protein, partial [Proteobacteria bacterium]|nr:YceI family protein [Pseudomonadota bacterium]MCP4919772.1 YceI family protein [Pseudomonadota bacterium]